MLEIFGFSIIFLYLLYASIYDIKNHALNPEMTLLFAVVALIDRIVFIYLEGGEKIIGLLGLTVGLIVFLIRIITRGQIGSGDAIVIMMCGINLDFFENLAVLLMAFMLAGFIGGIVLLIKHKNFRNRIPFVPFVFASYGVVVIWKMKDILI